MSINALITILPTYLIALAASACLNFLLMRLAPKIGLLDSPQSSNHKTHNQDIAVVGGISIFIAFCFALLFSSQSVAHLKPLLAAAIVLIITGVIDDLHQLQPLIRLVIQILACLIMIFFGKVVLSDLGHLVIDSLFELKLFAIPFTIFAIVGVINAFNMSDGMDGQSGTVASAMLVLMILLSLQQSNIQSASVFSALFGALAGFLIFNIRWLDSSPARVFMGDAGSMFVGLFIGWNLISLSQGQHAIIKPITALWIFAVPVCDALSVMIRRILNGHSALNPDQTHYHHLLQAAGFSINQILFCLFVSIILLGSLAFWIQDIRGIEKYMFYTYLLFVFIYYRWSGKQLNAIKMDNSDRVRSSRV